MSILAGMLIGGVAYTFAKTDQSMKMDEQARKKYAKAYDRQVAAQEIVKDKREHADNTLMKVANRKRAILTTSMQSFLEVYEQIIKIDFKQGEGIKELNTNILAPARISEIRVMTVNAVKPMSDKEVVVSYLFKGIGGVMVDESKRNLAMANSQVRASNVVYSQAETIVVALDGIIQRSEKIATVLAKLNLLFTQSIHASKKLIDERGFDRSKYSVEDRKTLMSCINIADTIKKIIDTPLLDNNGEIAKETEKAIEIGNGYLTKINQL